MTSTTVRTAHALRDTYPDMSPRNRLRYARSLATAPEYPDLDALDGIPGDSVTLDVGPYSVRVSIVPDDAPDMSWLGTFTDRWEPGAIRVPDDGRPRVWCYAPAAFTYARWFVPSGMRGTYEELRAYYSRAGYSRGDADYRARKDIRGDMMVALGYYPYGIVVTVSLAGVELGHDSLWGCDGDEPAETVREYDMIGQALDDARATLDTLDTARAGGDAQ